MAGYKGLRENSTKNMERDEAQINLYKYDRMYVCYYHVALAVASTSTNTLLEIGAMSEVYVIKVCDRKSEKHLNVVFTFIP